MTINPVWPFTKTVKKLASDNPVWSCIKYADKLISDNPVWSFTKQINKLGYINNPDWTDEMDDPKNHQPCGYWWVGPGCPIECGNWPRVIPTLPPPPPPPTPTYIGYVDLDFGWGTGGPDNICKIFPDIGSEVTVDNYPQERCYSSGLAFIEYIQEEGEEGEDPVIKSGIIKNESVGAYGENGIKIKAYEYDTGKYINTLATYSVLSYIHPGAVSISPNGLELWFSLTDDCENDCWVKSTRASTDDPFGTPVKQFNQIAAWKVLWDDAGEIWFAGKDIDYDGPACIYYSMNLIKRVSIDGWSTGFAFDDFGNLWVGTYSDTGPTTQQYLLLFSADSVKGSATLIQAHADATYTLPDLAQGDPPENRKIGVCDISYSGGHIYISANGGFNEEENDEIGCVLRISTHEGTSADPYAAQEDLKKIYIGPQTTNWNWVKSIVIGTE